jgi:hypothetical protein
VWRAAKLPLSTSIVTISAPNTAVALIDCRRCRCADVFLFFWVYAMIKNIGSVDRVIRVAVAIGVFILIATEVVSGIPAWILGIGAIILVATSAAGTCPMYLPFGISTRPKA